MADDLPSALNSDEVFTILQNLELAIVNLENATAQIISHQRTMSTTLTDSSDSSTQKFNHLLMQVGRKPSDLFAKYDAPDLWMAIANLASLLESIPTTSESDLVAIINLSVQRLKGEMKEHVKTTLGVDLKPLSNDIVAVQNYFMQGMNVLKGQIDAEGGRTDNLVNEVNAQKSSSHFNMSTINTTATNPDI